MNNELQTEFEKFKTLVETLYERIKSADEYLENVPEDIRHILIDNEFSNQLNLMNDILIEHTFGDLSEFVRWFLFTWTPDTSIEIDLQEVSFENEETFFSYVKEKYFDI